MSRQAFPTLRMTSFCHVTMDHHRYGLPYSITVHVCGSFVVVPCINNVTVPWNFTILSCPYYRAPYLYRSETFVTPFLTVSQTGVNSSVVENHIIRRSWSPPQVRGQTGCSNRDSGTGALTFCTRTHGRCP